MKTESEILTEVKAENDRLIALLDSHGIPWRLPSVSAPTPDEPETSRLTTLPVWHVDAFVRWGRPSNCLPAHDGSGEFRAPFICLFHISRYFIDFEIFHFTWNKWRLYSRFRTRSVAEVIADRVRSVWEAAPQLKRHAASVTIGISQNKTSCHPPLSGTGHPHGCFEGLCESSCSGRSTTW